MPSSDPRAAGETSAVQRAQTHIRKTRVLQMAISEAVPHSDIVFRRDGVGDYAVVFAHGILDDQYVWKAVIDQLTASELETVTFDVAGFGQPTEAPGPYTYDRLAADLAAVVDALDKPFALFDHS